MAQQRQPNADLMSIYAYAEMKVTIEIYLKDESINQIYLSDESISKL